MAGAAGLSPRPHRSPDRGICRRRGVRPPEDPRRRRSRSV